MYDVAIIGGGIIGCSIARELSGYSLKVCVLEKASDVGCGTGFARMKLTARNMRKSSVNWLGRYGITCKTTRMRKPPWSAKSWDGP